MSLIEGKYILLLSVNEIIEYLAYCDDELVWRCVPTQSALFIRGQLITRYNEITGSNISIDYDEDQ